MSCTITFSLAELRDYEIQDEDTTVSWSKFLKVFTSIPGIEADDENFTITFDTDVISKAKKEEKITVANCSKLYRNGEVIDAYEEWITAIDELREDNPEDGYPNLHNGKIYYSFDDIMQHAFLDGDSLNDTLNQLSRDEIIEMIGENGAVWFYEYQGENSENSRGSKSPEIEVKNVKPGGKLDAQDAKYIDNTATEKLQKKNIEQDLPKPDITTVQLPGRETQSSFRIKPVSEAGPARASEPGPARAEIESLSNILKGLSVDKPQKKAEEKPARTLEELTKLTGFSVITATNKKSEVVGGDADINKFILGLSGVSSEVQKKQKSPVITTVSPGQSAAAGGSVTKTRAKGDKEISPTGVEILRGLSIQKLESSMKARGSSSTSYSNNELSEILTNVGLKVSGSKADKIRRILDAIESIKSGGR